MASLQHQRATVDDIRAILFSFSMQFDRQRLLGPRQILMVLMFMIRDDCGYRRGLITISGLMGEEFGWKKFPPSAGSFSKARAKFKPADMMEMYRLAMRSPTAVSARNRWRWRGYRLVAADGVRFLLPAKEEIINTFKRPLVTGGEAYQPQMLSVTLWDVGACQPLSWRHRPCRGKGNGERAVLLQQLDQLTSTDLLLLDRGFPSRRLLFELVARDIPFVVRMTAGTSSDFAEVAAFMRKNLATDEADFTYRDPDCTPTLVERLRLVRDIDEDSSGCVLVTNLMDPKAFTAQDIIHVYQRRWGIETAFKDMKMRCKIEGFHGSTPDMIEQEIIALMFLMLIESLVEETALKTLPVSKQGNGDQRQPVRCNRAALGDRIKSLLNLAIRPTNDRRLMKEFRRALDAVAKDRQPVRRPGRGRERECLSQFGRWRFKKSAAKAA